MNKSNTSDRGKLLGLLSKRLELFEQLYGLCEQQANLISEEKPDKLEKSLGKALELREKINGLHQETEELMQSCLSLASDTEVKEQNAKIKEITKKCAALNEKNTEATKTMIEGQKKKIDEQSAKRKGIGGYVQAVSNKPELFDQKG